MRYRLLLIIGFTVTFFAIVGLSLYEECLPNDLPPSYFISYADGSPVYFANQKLLTASAQRCGFTEVLELSRSDLLADFVAKNSAILMQSRGAGYWIWKPHIILQQMKRLPEGAIIVYLDAGTLLRGSVAPLVRLADREGLVLVRGEHPHKVMVKRDCLIGMGCDAPEYRNAREVDVGRILIKNTKENRVLVEKWLALCEDERLVTDLSSGADELSEFWDHRHDQAILSLLIRRDSPKCALISRSDARKFWWVHRRRDIATALSTRCQWFKSLISTRLKGLLINNSNEIEPIVRIRGRSASNDCKGLDRSVASTYSPTHA